MLISHVIHFYFNMLLSPFSSLLFVLQLLASFGADLKANRKRSKRARFCPFCPNGVLHVDMVFATDLPARSFNDQGNGIALMEFAIALMAFAIIIQTTVLRKWRFYAVFSNLFSLHFARTIKGSYKDENLYKQDSWRCFIVSKLCGSSIEIASQSQAKIHL